MNCDNYLYSADENKLYCYDLAGGYRNVADVNVEIRAAEEVLQWLLNIRKLMTKTDLIQ